MFVAGKPKLSRCLRAELQTHCSSLQRIANPADRGRISGIERGTTEAELEFCSRLFRRHRFTATISARRKAASGAGSPGLMALGERTEPDHLGVLGVQQNRLKLSPDGAPLGRD